MQVTQTLSTLGLELVAPPSPSPSRARALAVSFLGNIIRCSGISDIWLILRRSNTGQGPIFRNTSNQICFCFQVRQGRKLDSPPRMLIWKGQPQSRSLEHLCRSQSPRFLLFQHQHPTSTLSLDNSPFPLELRGQ